MIKDENSKRDINLKDYDSGGVSLWKMSFGLWLSENRQLMLKILTTGLIFISAFFFIFSTYQYVRYFMVGDPNDDVSADNLVFSPRKVTDDLVIAPLQVFPAGGKIDLVAPISNPNDNFMATFRACFRQGDKEISCQTDFILPAEDKHLVALGLALDNTSGLTFSVEEIFWRRISTRQITDWPTFLKERLQFSVTNLKFLPAHRSDLSSQVDLNSLNFSLTNNTSYGYYQVPLTLLFYNKTQLVGINRYVLNDFLPGQQREVNLSWTAPLASVDRVEVKPSVNIMDDTVYLLYNGR